MLIAMRRLLVLAGAGFAPDVDGGVFRPLKMVKYLEEWGYSATVIAPPNPFAQKDPSLLAQLPGSTKVVHLSDPFFPLRHHSLRKILKLFFIDEPEFLWGRRAAKHSMGIEERWDAILSTSPPAASHLAALRIKERLDIPWIADFRDPWTQHPERWVPSRFHASLGKKKEQRVARGADRIVFASPEQGEDLKRMYPWTKDKLRVIPNGFDPEDYSNPPPKATPPVIAHVGTLYHHYPLDAFEAFADLTSSRSDMLGGARLVLCGKIDQGQRRRIEAIGGGAVEFTGQIPMKEALGTMMSAQILVLTLPDIDSYKNVYTTHLFHYLASGTYILATLPQGSVARDLVLGTHSGQVFDPGDVKGVKEALAKCLVELKETGRIRVEQDRGPLERYDRRLQAKRLAEELDVLLS